MKNNTSPQDRNKNPASSPKRTAAAALDHNGTPLVPSADEVARRAYFAYLNDGSQPGRDEKHWLEAEAQLWAEIGHIHQVHN